MIHLRRVMISTLLCTVMSAGVLAADADGTAGPGADDPDATVELTGGTVAAGVGYVWGHGSVTFQGKKHAFKLSGLSVVDVGASHLSASGAVYHLKDLSDFSGTYTAVTAGITVAGGGSAAVLRNQHGVVIKLTATTEGVRFNLSANGIAIKLKP